ncbi:hypothetical protein JTB14_036877 [Gonioctena quinquepunctata]|nr:hypothetical protein JTB14_036877 [Gonioctena quinquepunctata]
MMFSGTWRLKLETESELLQKCYNIYSFLVQSYFGCFVITLFMQLPEVWEDNKAKLFENLGVSIFCVIMIMKILMCQSKNIVLLLSEMMDAEQKILQSNVRDEKIYRDQVDHTNKINLSVSLYTCGLVGIPLVMLNYVSYLQFEKTHLGNTTEHKPLPYVSWFPFDPDEYHWVAFSMHSLDAFMGCTYNTLTQLFFITLMTFMTTRLKILQRHFRNFDVLEDGTENIINLNEDDVVRSLKTFIAEHTGIIENVVDLNESLKYLMLLEFLMNSVQIASLLVQLLTSAELSIALYQSTWYEHSTTVKKYIHMMMLRSQKPLTLQIGPFYPMTMATALSTMKAAYSYVTILSK